MTLNDLFRFIFGGFGTPSIHADPCKNIFQRFFAYFSPPPQTDNTNVNIWPIGDKVRAIHNLRLFLSIFDQTLTAHFLKTDDARTNRFLLLKQLTPKVHDDTISDDTAPSSGSSELIKFKT